MKHIGYVYIMTNKNKNVLYIGVTNNIIRRVREHKCHLNKGSFTTRYNVEYCIYYEQYPSIVQAIHREKQLKGWTRQKKNALINSKNPNWKEVTV